MCAGVVDLEGVRHSSSCHIALHQPDRCWISSLHLQCHGGGGCWEEWEQQSSWSQKYPNNNLDWTQALLLVKCQSMKWSFTRIFLCKYARNILICAGKTYLKTYLFTLSMQELQTLPCMLVHFWYFWSAWKTKSSNSNIKHPTEQN